MLDCCINSSKVILCRGSQDLRRGRIFEELRVIDRQSIKLCQNLSKSKDLGSKPSSSFGKPRGDRPLIVDGTKIVIHKRLCFIKSGEANFRFSR
jgi:hypothetical protein